MWLWQNFFIFFVWRMEIVTVFYFAAEYSSWVLIEGLEYTEFSYHNIPFEEPNKKFNLNPIYDMFNIGIPSVTISSVTMKCMIHARIMHIWLKTLLEQWSLNLYLTKPPGFKHWKFIKNFGAPCWF